MIVMDSSDREVAKFIRGLKESSRNRVVGVHGLEADAESIAETSYGKAVVAFAREKMNQGASAPEVVEEYLSLGQSHKALFVLPSSFVDAVEERFLRENPNRAFGPDQKEMLGRAVTEMVQDKVIVSDFSNLSSESAITSAATRVSLEDSHVRAKAEAARADLAAEATRAVVNEIAQPEISSDIEDERKEERGHDGGR